MDAYRRLSEQAAAAGEDARPTRAFGQAAVRRADAPPRPYELFVAGVLCLTPFLYGIHIGELNIPQKVITSCGDEASQLRGGGVSPPAFAQRWLPASAPESGSSFPPSLPRCLPMTGATFSLAVSMFTLGGLVGSLVAGRLADTHGRWRSVCLANAAFLLAALIEALARDPGELFMGRLLAGVASGVGVVVVPTYLSEVAPANHRGLFGTLHQVGIVCGILFIQVLGLFLSYVPGWRTLLGISAVPAGLQLVLMSAVVHSPRHLARMGRLSDAIVSLQRLRGITAAEAERELTSCRYRDDDHEGHRDSEANDREVLIAAGSPVVATENGGTTAAAAGLEGSRVLSVLNVVSTREYRMPMAIVLLLHLAQQLSGINAVMYYSTAIMSSVFPGRSASITVAISLVNVLMTLPSVYLIDRAGRRLLVLGSLGSMCAATTCLAFSMWQGLDALAALTIVLFVATFSLGMGPIPFLIISEVFDARAVGSAASIGLSVNWIANFVVGAAFLPLTEALNGSSAGVFVLFAAVQLAALAVALRILPETKGKSAEQVMREFCRG